LKTLQTYHEDIPEPLDATLPSRLATLCNTLMSAAEALLKARSETSALRRLCTLLVRSGLFASARLGHIDAQSRYQTLVMQAGPRTRIIRRVLETYSPLGDFDSVSLTAWRTGGTQINNQAEGVAMDEAGWQSLAAMPVKRAGKIWAVLTVDAASPRFFDPQMQSLLERLAAMIGHTLDELDTKSALRADHDVLNQLSFKALLPAITPPTPESGSKTQAESRALLANGGLLLHYQPVVDICTGAITGTEALARLQEHGKLIPPAQFLNHLLLEDRNLLFRKVVEQALRQMQEWDRGGLQLTMSVNVDAQTLLLDETMEFLRAIFAQTGISPRRMALEILETHDFLDLEKARTRLIALRSMGLRIALDDVGIGYSSILKLRDLPLDVVKLDRAFIRGLRARPDDLVFISGMQMIAGTLGLSLVVEGIETDDILDALRIMEAGYAQGFGIARPMPGASIIDWAARHRPSPATQEPATLLGAYAMHLNWFREFQSGRITAARPPVTSSLDSFLQRTGLRTGRIGQAYGALQATLGQSSYERTSVLAAAERFRETLMEGLATV
jgi:EAL domain-containing protein (putative c-di-GMP-specific phosphodiesterase class I)